MSKLDRAIQMREYFAEKAQRQLKDALDASLRDDVRVFECIKDDLETSLIIVARFDRKISAISNGILSDESLHP